jgi:hypothetical protein
MTDRLLVLLAASAALGWFALAQDAGETDSLAEDFDALFSPEPETRPGDGPAGDLPDAPVSLGPEPTRASPEPDPPAPAEPAEQVREPAAPPADATGDGEKGEPGDGQTEETGEADETLEMIRWNQYETATLRGLDKITGRFMDIDMEVGTPVTFGTLRVEVQTCFQTPPDLPPESAAFVRVHSLPPMESDAGLEPEPLIFSGWMFASSPGLNALEHPVNDVWVIECAEVELPDPATGQ